MLKKPENKIVALNKKINHLYQIKETFKAGMILFGDEVKSIKSQKINLDGSFIKISPQSHRKSGTSGIPFAGKNNQAYLTNIKIPKYKKSNLNTIKHKPGRDIKILLNKKEIIKLKTFLNQKNYAIVPTKIFIKNNLIKIEIALASGKKKYDKREDMKKKDLKRKLDQKYKLHI